jgi:hypothetical protein
LKHYCFRKVDEFPSAQASTQGQRPAVGQLGQPGRQPDNQAARQPGNRATRQPTRHPPAFQAAKQPSNEPGNKQGAARQAGTQPATKPSPHSAVFPVAGWPHLRDLQEHSRCLGQGQGLLRAQGGTRPLPALLVQRWQPAMGRHHPSRGVRLHASEDHQGRTLLVSTRPG